MTTNEMTQETELVEMLNNAFDDLNAELFAGELPLVVVTLQRHRGAYGYFAPHRFSSVNNGPAVHEIALNPDTFLTHRDRDILGTLAHEMAHLWQEEKGTPPRRCYHDKQWAAKMKEIGLQPVSVSNPGKETGQSCTHTIIDGGPFDQAAQRIIAGGFRINYHSESFADLVAGLIGKFGLPGGNGGNGGQAPKAKKTKVAYVCPTCGNKVWGKPAMNIHCGDCDEQMSGE